MYKNICTIKKVIKEKLLLVLIATLLTTFVGCANTAATDDSEKDTTVVTESELESEQKVATKDWKDMSVTIEGREITLGMKYGEISDFIENATIVDYNNNGVYSIDTPHEQWWRTDAIMHVDGVTLPSYQKLEMAYETNTTDHPDAKICLYDCVFKLETIYDVDNGDATIPDIVLPNGIKIGDHVYEYEELNEKMDATAEVKSGGAYCDYADRYIYTTEDGKEFTVFVAGNRIIGFRMEVPYKDWVTYPPYEG